MHELNRQAYLSAFGIENYMPRWRLPIAPESFACEMPELVATDLLSKATGIISNTVIRSDDMLGNIQSSTPSPVAAMNVLADLVGSPKVSSVTAAPISAASILQQFETPPKIVALAPFSLSIWRPLPGFLIIDSRNTRLALPTDMLLSNLMRVLFKDVQARPAEEVLSWPMVENRFVSRTAEDARSELQTWLAVEAELRPINRLWLMGDNAARYFLAADQSPQELRWQGVSINTQLNAIILPSLNELLQTPLLKAKLWSCVR